MSSHDVVVVGGGFAGVTAARELAHAGHRVALIEARDRLGGRTWTAEFAGTHVEMGGTWVHWHQPHVWAEMRRYGLELTESPAPERAGWLVGKELKLGDPEEAFAIINDGVRRLCGAAPAVLPRPHDVGFTDLGDVEGRSVQDAIDALELDPEAAALLDAAWATCCSAHVRETGLLAALRWYALSGNDPQLMWDCVVRYKIRTGTKSLVEAIAADGGAEIRLSTPIASVAQDGTGVTITTRDGEAITSRAAIVALPLNALGSIAFSPALSDGKRAAAAEGQSSHGVKVWVRVRGRHPYFGAAPSTHPFTWLQAEYEVDGDTIFLAFGSDADMIDVHDRQAVATAVEALLPGAEVVDSHAHDWTHDEFAAGTWSMPRPGQMSRYLPELQRPEGRVVLAGSDVASGWNGFIDGAIESGLTAARQARAILAG